MTGFAFIACSKSKLDHAAPARELYTGDLFRRSVAYAEARGLMWGVLSARHGLVWPDVELAPYEQTLATMSRAEREAWGRAVRARIADVVPRGARVVLLAGALYREPIESVLVFADVETPLRGLGIGQQRAWLTRETKRIREMRRVAA